MKVVCRHDTFEHQANSCAMRNRPIQCNTVQCNAIMFDYWQLESLPAQSGFPVKGMTLRCGILVLFPHFDCVNISNWLDIGSKVVKSNVLVLSASPHIKRRPVRSYVELIRPASASREPGCAVVSSD